MHRNLLLPLFLLLVTSSSDAAMPPVPVPLENPISEEKRVLGKILFWEEQLSSDDTVACGTCHIPASGGADPREAVHPGPDGVFGNSDDIVGSRGIARFDANLQPIYDPLFGYEPRVTRRTAPSYFASAWAPDIFWDGRAKSAFVDPLNPAVTLIAEGGALESQAVGPILSTVEMAREGRTWADVTTKLEAVTPMFLASALPADMADAIAANPSYPALFLAAFGDPQITPARIGMAIATYERTLVPDQTPWDLFMEGDPTALTSSQALGWQIFGFESTCGRCHVPPLFTDNAFYNVGLRPSSEDLGREEVTGDPADRGRFKVPSLRNVGLNPSLMHVGWVTSVFDATQFYNTATDPNEHSQFTMDQSDIPTSIPGFFLPYSAANLFGETDEGSSIQSVVVDFLANGLTDPRVAAEEFPFDRPVLASELSLSSGGAAETVPMSPGGGVLLWLSLSVLAFRFLEAPRLGRLGEAISTLVGHLKGDES